MKCFLVALVLLVISFQLTGQPAINPRYYDYVARYKDKALREMYLYKIPASITLAQAIIESNTGKSILATQANNHFGIKCTKEWVGDTFFYDDDEKNECFRKYQTDDESFRDHSLFLTTRPRYSDLFSLDILDYTGWAQGLKKAGYATNPEYANILIRIIEENQLYLFDRLTAGSETASGDSAAEKASLQANPSRVIATPDLHHRVLFREGYRGPTATGYKELYRSQFGRPVYENNGIPFVLATADDNFSTIAKEFSIYTFQVYKNNDLKRRDVLVPGQVVYLEPKKIRCATPSHKVGKWDTLYSISQQYGIKLKRIYTYNKWSPGYEPEQGTVVKLRK